MIHQRRASLVGDHTRLINRLRRLLAEFGVVVPMGADALKRSCRAAPTACGSDPTDGLGDTR